MIKATSEPTPASKLNLEYPVLMKYEESTKPFVVLFTGPNCGTVIDAGSSNYNVGYYSAGWSSVTYDSTWTKFHGKVTLENA